ncbi:hypothetical protein PV325_000448 [Microctonus aethiopoides]|uniref:Heat shock protein 70 n=1 Tax=Microctonus aethiopoides TaxID=144406 RepID=A0AA39KXU5_9HYME|nr:hypothetical protein PV325_000448 [Microctonus aethiopoides]KAK0177657.1 hypothetical protein PV328_001690 [Microctonus aethiopoides]
MLAEAERYRAQDEEQRDKVAARNQLESYVFSVKQALQEHGSKLDEADRNQVTQMCDETIKWLDNNTLAEKEEYKDKLDELQKKCSAIMTKLHQNGGASQSGPQDCGSQFRQGGGQNYSGPTVEEVD